MIKLRFILLFLIVSNSVFSQYDHVLRNIGANKKNYSFKDTSIVNQLNEIAGDSSFINPDLSEFLAKAALRISKRIEYKNGECSSLLSISAAKVYSNQLDSAYYYSRLALRIAKSLSSEKWTIKSLEMLGNIYAYDEKYKEAIDYQIRATTIAEKKYPSLLPSIYGNMAHVFRSTDNNEKSWEYCQKALKYGSKYADSGAIITAYNLMGLIERSKDREGALGYFKKGLEVAEKNGHVKRISEILYNMSNVYFDMGETDLGFEYFNRSIEISKSSKSYRSIAIGYHAMAYNYHDIGDEKNALRYADSALHYAYLTGNYDIIMESHALKANLYAFIEDYFNGMTHLSQAYAYKDSLNLAEINGAISEDESKYESEKKDLKIKLERKRERQLSNQKIKARENILLFTCLALLLFIIGAFYLRYQNKQIKSKNRLVENQKHEIEQQHNAITDSIRYAERIQRSLLPSRTDWGPLREKFSLFFKPRDLVSGDFYWTFHDPETNRTYFAVADCTGHGVPGSLVSMLAISSLNEIVKVRNELDAGQILGVLRERIISALTKDDETAKDGLDISLGILHHNEQRLDFAGANNNLWLIRNKIEALDLDVNIELGDHVLLEIPGDRMPIGEYLKILPDFTTKRIELKKGDQVVLYTDGFADQFGGPEGKKFKYGALKRLILEHAAQTKTKIPSSELERKFNQWKGTLDQTDDVCIFILEI